MNAVANSFQDKISWWVATSDHQGGYNFELQPTLTGRWEEKQELYRRFGSGEDTASSVVIYLMGDGEMPQILDYLCLGVLLTERPPTTALQVNQVAKTPDLRNLRNLVKIWL